MVYKDVQTTNIVVYRLIHLRKEVKTIQLGVVLEAPQEEFEQESDWMQRIEELGSSGFSIYVKENTAYAVKPGVHRKI